MSSEIQRAIQALVEREPGWQRFQPAPTKGAKPAAIGKGVPGGAGSSRGGGGLEESDYNQRTFWPVSTLSTFVTSDGIFMHEEEPLKSISLVGGGLFSLKEPVAAP